MNQFYDLAADTAKEIQDQMTASLEDSLKEYTDEVDETRLSLFHKISYSFKGQDRAALTQLRASADEVLVQTFGEFYEILDRLYSEFRVVQTNEHGIVMKDEHGRPLWVKNESGQYEEDLSLLTGQDIEKALLDLQRLKIHISQVVSELFLEALFAKYAFDDEHADAYRSVLDGTIDDRKARANQKTRESKYLAFFRYFIWTRTDTFNKEVNNTVRLLERIRQWRISDNYGG